MSENPDKTRIEFVVWTDKEPTENKNYFVVCLTINQLPISYVFLARPPRMSDIKILKKNLVKLINKCNRIVKIDPQAKKITGGVLDDVKADENLVESSTKKLTIDPENTESSTEVVGDTKKLDI